MLPRCRHARFPAPATPAYEILFAFTGHAGTVLEIKRLGLPADAPRSRKYQWLWVDAGNNPAQVLPLRFVSMNQGMRQERVFAEGTLRFDEREAELAWHTAGTLHLQAWLPYAAPAAVAKLVARFVAEQ
ncbi:hypothetical protein UB46_11205 [Burkholderiaceae bacterium 16]|nr:hypothetical protein UB46_11205 [Burkholderiaceae bacterium 16]